MQFYLLTSAQAQDDSNLSSGQYKGSICVEQNTRFIGITGKKIPLCLSSLFIVFFSSTILKCRGNCSNNIFKKGLILNMETVLVDFKGSFIEPSLYNFIFRSASLSMNLQYSSVF